MIEIKRKCEICGLHNAYFKVKTVGGITLKLCNYCVDELLPYIKSIESLKRYRIVKHHDIVGKARLVVTEKIKV